MSDDGVAGAFLGICFFIALVFCGGMLIKSADWDSQIQKAIVSGYYVHQNYERYTFKLESKRNSTDESWKEVK